MSEERRKAFTKKRVVLCAAVVLLAAAIGLVVANHDSTPMPVYQGKTAREWLLSTGSSEADTRAYLAFKAMGSNAVPFLAHELERVSVWEKINRWIYPKSPWRIRKHLPHPAAQEQRRFEAASALSVMRSRTAIPYMIHMLNKGEDGQRQHALYVLKAIVQPGDTDCIPAITNGLRSMDVYVCADAVEVLKRMNSEKLGIPALTNFISSTKWQTRIFALDSLSNLDPENPDKWHAMLTNDPDWQAEQRAAEHR